MQPSWFSNVRNDVVGGLVSAAVAIPLAIGFGMFAFVSLGDEYFADGALAGLAAAFIAGIVSVLLGDRSAAVYAPRINSTFFIGLLLYHLAHSDAQVLKSASLSLTLVVFFSIILLGGAFQALFGLIRLGSLIKFAPHPVMAGFQNTAALLLFLVQMGNVFGFDRNTPFTAVFSHLGGAKPLSILIAVIVFVAMWNSKKIVPKVPPLVVGLALGTGLYYGLSAIGLAPYLGPVIGTDANAAVNPAPYSNFGDLAHDGRILEILPTILGGALALAIIASIDALLCAKLITQPGDAKMDGDRLLVRLGIGNMITACFGGITSGLNIGASLTNRAFGGRTPLSALVNAAAVLVTFAALFPVVAYTPRVALSAVIMVIAIQHFDPWTTQQIRRLASSSGRPRRFILLDLLVVVLVAVLSITVNIVLAVFIGVAIAVLLFVVRMSRSIVRRMYRCDAVRSRTSRTAEEAEILERRGGSILVMELQGALFFGTAEKLAAEIEAVSQDAGFVILDLRRITEIDSTGARIMLDIQADLARQKKRLAVSVATQGETAARLTDFAASHGSALEKSFEDVDRAIEWAEDELLREDMCARRSEQEMALDQVGILSSFAPGDIAAIKPYLVRATYERGRVIFNEGDPGRELFIVVKGAASAYLRQSDGGTIRLATFAPGTIFGELAILDSGPRSASVMADSDLVAYSLSDENFTILAAQAPAVAIRLLASLGRELSGRLRRANRTIHQLEI